jgi:protein-L-isoaspartate(D-aspartate) O-methyltransferase
MDNDTLVEACRTSPHYLLFKNPRDEKVLRAIWVVDRMDFIPPGSGPHVVYHDNPVDIGQNQTCSQPSLVAFMSDVLELEEGMHVLEIGTGCGYHAAVTSNIIGFDGKLTSVEYKAMLANMASENLRRHFAQTLDQRIELIKGDGSQGYAHNAPYDRIYFAAAASPSFDPLPLARQLRQGTGILLFPQRDGLRGSLVRLRYKGGQEVSRDSYAGIGFVNLCGRNK